MAKSLLDCCTYREIQKATVHIKGEVIATFSNEYGEYANQEEWIVFLHKHQVIFEWTLSVD